MIVGLVVALVAALVPTAAWAVPDPSTVTVTASQGAVARVHLGVTVTSTGSTAGGIVSFSEGGVEIGRSPISANSTASLNLDRPVPGPHTYVASFLGTATAEPSTGSASITVLPVSPTSRASGTISIGSALITFGSPDTSSRVDYDQSLGRFYLRDFASVATELTVDVAGTGRVTIAVTPNLRSLYATFDQGGRVNSPDTDLELIVERITVGGVTWTEPCRVFPGNYSARVATDATGIVFTTPYAESSVSGCGDRANLVTALLHGPVMLVAHVDGPFPLPPPPIPTSTTLTVVGSGYGVGDPVPVRATVSTGVCCPSTPLVVTFSENGTVLATASTATNVAQAVVVLDSPGPHTITARYGGQTSSGLFVFGPSTGTATVDIAAPPPGRPTSGTFWSSSALGEGTRLVGAPFDPVTGAIGSGSFWFPQAELVISHPFGLSPVRYRLTQLAPMTGQVASDGTVRFTPITLELEARQAQIFGSWAALAPCTFSPIELNLSGTADAGGLHLTATSGPIPAVPANGCGGYGSYVNPYFTSGLTFTFDVAGDFARADATPVGVVSWFSEVAQYNQTLVTASVAAGRGSGDPVPSGSVTFRDGAVVVGTVPVDGSGNASLPVTLSSAGSHTVVAVYSGDGSYGVGSATTSVEVTPAPVGYAVGGSVTVGGASLPVGPGSQLVPASPPGSGVSAAGQVRDALASSSAALWFMPTTVTVDAPGYGSVQAEVRLVQYGAMSQAAIGSGGSVEGLAGMFVLQVRKVVTGSGTELPLGCVNLVLLAFDGHMTFSDVSLTSAQAGVGRIPVGQCTGAGAAVITKLASGPTAADLHATF